MADSNEIIELNNLDITHREDTAELREYVLTYRSALRMEVITFIFDSEIARCIENPKIRAKIFLNEDILTELVYSYFQDIDRYKEFHEISLVNEIKKAGFLMKWIVKHRPIAYDAKDIDDEDLRGFLLYVNEYFAFRCGLFYADIEFDDVDDKLLHRMLYDLLYRHHDEHTLSLWFKTYYVLNGISLDDQEIE